MISVKSHLMNMKIFEDEYENFIYFIERIIFF